jgi:putative ABC transport system permease protein
MRPLDRKLLRDLWRLRGQVLAIAGVMGSGVGVLVMSLSTLDALQQTAATYYERYAFADVFAQSRRAPERIVERIREIPGVQAVETRVVGTAVLDIAGFDEPVLAQLVSIPERREPLLNRLALRSGRAPQAGSPDEVLISEPFANAHGLAAGDTLRAILNGRWRELRVVGTALSPEYVYAIGPGALMPDDRRFGVLWLGREALQAAFDLEGAFNDVSLSLLRGVDPSSVIDRLDPLLGPHGGIGAYARRDQISNWFLMNEMEQLRSLSSILPSIFLAVAAFLTHMVLARLIAVERSEIGLLKAFGYRSRDIAAHYAKLALAIGAAGVCVGWAIGYQLGRYNTRQYADFYHFPFLLYRPGARAFAIGAAVGLGTALAAALVAVRRATALSPAEAMRPPAPPLFRRTRLGRSPLVRWLDQPTLILVRQVVRWPARSLLTSAGIGLSVAVLLTSMQWLDAIYRMVDVYFLQAQVQDVTVGFSEPRSREVARDLARLPGVLFAEPMRVVAARLRHGTREKREAVQGLPAHQELFRVYDSGGRAIDLPPGGLVISTMLATLLDVGLGDRVSIEVLEGRRPIAEVPVVALFDTYIGSPAYMEIGALSRLLGESPSASAVHLRTDALQRGALFRDLKGVPSVSSVVLREAAVRGFHETLARTMLIFVSFFLVLSCMLALGVTYNAARIALSERGRELATLRVLGFTRAETSYILLGEIALLTLAALPLGCGLGYGLALLIVQEFETELYRVPFVIEPSTYGWALSIVLAATTAAALLVRARIDRLDLIAVLKARE